MPMTLLIVDDHEEFRRSARALLEAGGFNVVGEASDAAAAMAEVVRLRPTLVLLDIQLPDSDGFDVAVLLAGLTDPPAVVLTSSRDRTAYRCRLAATPALGFVAKADLSSDALTALLA
jgi:DNA-binding NarL/FixJ family response regulator